LLNVSLYGVKTVSELEAFEESDTGKMQGKSDNLVIACGLGILGLIRFASRRGAHLVQQPENIIIKPNYWAFTLDDALIRIDERRQRGRYG